MSRAFVVGLVCAAALVGCDPPPSPTHGPSGGILEFDAAAFEPPSAGDDASTPLPDSSGGTSRCTGSATPCSLLPTSECALVSGCKIEGTCTGSPYSCGSFLGSTSCVSQQGCYWSYSSNYCSGVATSCSDFTSSTSCVFQSGCHWKDTCGGVVTPCSLLSDIECTSTPGCTLVRN